MTTTTTETNGLTPVAMMILLQLYCFPMAEDCTMINNTTSSKVALLRLQEHELIHPIKNVRIGRVGYELTPRGIALVEKWKRTPLPVLEERWV